MDTKQPPMTNGRLTNGPVGTLSSHNNNEANKAVANSRGASVLNSKLTAKSIHELNSAVVTGNAKLPNGNAVAL